MRPAFLRDLFASDLKNRLDEMGLSYRQAVGHADYLNPAMISRAIKCDRLTVESFLALCHAFELDPMAYAIMPGKQDVTAFDKRETSGVAA